MKLKHKVINCAKACYWVHSFGKIRIRIHDLRSLILDHGVSKEQMNGCPEQMNHDLSDHDLDHPKVTLPKTTKMFTDINNERRKYVKH